MAGDSPEADPNDFRWLLGIPIAIFGATLTSTGWLVQKTGLNAAESSSWACLDWRWMCGIALFAAGNFVSYIALGMAPQTVLSCFNSWNIVYSIIVGPLFLGEYVSNSTRRCALILVLGCVWVACTGPRSYRIETTESVRGNWEQTNVRIITLLCIVGAVVAKLRHSLISMRSSSAPVSTKATAQLIVIASISATYAVLFSKTSSLLVYASVAKQNNNQINLEFYACMGGSVLCAVCQIYFLNLCLAEGEVSYVVPAYEAMSIAFQITIGGMLFREFDGYTPEKHLCFWPGVLLVVVGIILLTRSSELDRNSRRRSTLAAEAENGAQADAFELQSSLK